MIRIYDALYAFTCIQMEMEITSPANTTQQHCLAPIFVTYSNDCFVLEGTVSMEHYGKLTAAFANKNISFGVWSPELIVTTHEEVLNLSWLISWVLKGFRLYCLRKSAYSCLVPIPFTQQQRRGEHLCPLLPDQHNKTLLCLIELQKFRECC